jgi:uncharacterized membrane protein YfcA
MIGSVVIAIFLLSIGASFVQRTTGFGFGIFIMTILLIIGGKKYIFKYKAVWSLFFFICCLIDGKIVHL